MTNALDTISGDVYSVQQTFEAAKVDRSLNFEAEAGFAIQALMASEYAMKIATQNRQSVVNAVTNIAAIGISLNPAKKQAYLVPRDGKICLDISYMGLMDLAIASGSIRWGQCLIVHEADEFERTGIDKEPRHKFRPFSKDRGPFVGVYVVVKTTDGDYLTHTMELGDVYDIRDRSKAWQAWVDKQRSCPWVTDEGEMIKKTCVKQAYKYWPKGEGSGRLEAAIHHLNESEEGLPPLAADEGGARPGDLSSFPAQHRTIVRATAAAAIQAFNEGKEWTALEEVTSCVDRIGKDDQPLRNEVLLALNGIFKPHSALRAYLKEQMLAAHGKEKAGEPTFGDVVA
mgnify:FL=1